MSKFSPSEISRIRAESEKLLRDPPARPEPAPEPPRKIHVVIGDPVQEWREAADAFERKCEEHRAEMRRGAQAREAAFGRRAWGGDALGARVAALQARPPAVERAVTGLGKLATAVVPFSNPPEKKWAEREDLLRRRAPPRRALAHPRRGEIIDLPGSPLL